MQLVHLYLDFFGCSFFLLYTAFAVFVAVLTYVGIHKK